MPPQVRLKPRKAAPFFGRHPWVLESAVDTVSSRVDGGAVVDLVAENGDYIATGIFNPQSRIRVRLYSWQRDLAIDGAWWERQILAACDLRNDIGLKAGVGAFRWINSEADGLSGLIVDQFGPYLVVQPTSLGVWQRLESLVGVLRNRIQPQGVVVHLDPKIAKREGISSVMPPTWGEPPTGPIQIEEHGLRYTVDLAQSQKTGFYLDQRLNRAVAATYLKDRRVADICCYSGGFSLCAERLGQASEVIGVDTSRAAVELAQRHADLNECERCRFEVSDCFKWLDEAVNREEKFGAVILDPPKFASGRKGAASAMRAYHRLNLQAMKILEPGGFLITCSCTGSVQREEFIDVIHGVAVRTKRSIQILENRGAAPDHPVGTHCRENDYLKCLICRVG